MANVVFAPEALTAESQSFIGKRIEQVRCSSPEYQKFVGRKGTVEEAFTDEKGNVHVKTREDGVWCPVALCAALD
jgi:hypothetical protein